MSRIVLPTAGAALPFPLCEPLVGDDDGKQREQESEKETAAFWVRVVFPAVHTRFPGCYSDRFVRSTAPRSDRHRPSSPRVHRRHERRAYRGPAREPDRPRHTEHGRRLRTAVLRLRGGSSGRAVEALYGQPERCGYVPAPVLVVQGHSGRRRTALRPLWSPPPW